MISTIRQIQPSRKLLTLRLRLKDRCLVWIDRSLSRLIRCILKFCMTSSNNSLVLRPWWIGWESSTQWWKRNNHQLKKLEILLRNCLLQISRGRRENSLKLSTLVIPVKWLQRKLLSMRSIGWRLWTKMAMDLSICRSSLSSSTRWTESSCQIMKSNRCSATLMLLEMANCLSKSSPEPSLTLLFQMSLKIEAKVRWRSI